MKIHTWQSLAILVLLIGFASSTALGDSDDPGVTDFSAANAGAIEMSDITSALAVPRGTRIEPAAPPTVRLPIYFESNSTTLRPEGQKLLDKVGAAMTSEELTTFRFSVEGHTDSIGSEAYNSSLSARRADAVKKYLMDHGVSAERVQTVGRGESNPVADNQSDEGRQRNRRVELVNLGSGE